MIYKINKYIQIYMEQPPSPSNTSYPFYSYNFNSSKIPFFFCLEFYKHKIYPYMVKTL